MSDVTTVAKDVLELSQSRPEKQVYMSLPRPGVSKVILIIHISLSLSQNPKLYENAKTNRIFRDSTR